MDNRRESQRPTTLEHWDELVREPLPPEPRFPLSWGRIALLGALAVLLVVTVVGASVYIIHDLRTPGVQTTKTPPAAHATIASGTPTPTVSSNPKDNGWTQVTPAGGDVTFSTSSPQRGYLCGTDNQSGRIIVGVTTDGGQTWGLGQSQAAYESCSIQVSPTNALAVVVTSQEGSCAAPCPLFDAHYSIDGGKTWKAAPIPQNTIAPGGAIWSAANLYLWAGANQDSGQSGFLKVSASGGPFASIDLKRLLPGAQNVSIASAVAGSTTLYLNLTYTGCSAQLCQAIVASGDGGKTWAQVPNQSNIQLVYVVGSTLYGQMNQGPATTLALSRDNGASWTTLTLPPLPGGQPLSLQAQGSWLPAPDGTLFTAPYEPGVAYLRGGVWTILPFSSSYASLDTVAAISFGANGQPQRIWGLSSPQASSHGIYWHAYP
jgi:BNR/Asp-box repeat